MIRHAYPEDREAIFNIWRACFGDKKEYIDFFLDNSFDPDRCLVWDDNGHAVAMLHLRTADYASDNAKLNGRPVMYIYAAATLPEYQRRGIMAKLIAAANDEAAAQGCIFTFLLPAKDSLYQYYAKLGYITAFSIKRALLSKNELSKFKSKQINPDNIGALEKRREHFLPSIQWRKQELSYALKEWSFVGGETVHFRGGYVMARKKDDDVVEVKEACGRFEDVAAVLLDKCDSLKYGFLLAPYADYPFPTITDKYGMIKPIAIPDDCDIIREKPYVNLMLD